MSSPEGGATAAASSEPEDEAPPVDERRQALLESFQAELGDEVVGSHIRPGDDLWIRVSNQAWRTAGDVARHKLDCTYFDFLSVIDWLPSPYGRDMDSQEDIIVHGADAGKAARPAEGSDPEPIATGYAGGDSRMQVFARVVSLAGGYGFTLKADLADVEPSVATWVPVYAGANWHEREAWEMFGVDFVGHPNLIHMYLPGDFEGHPMRKDFPLLARRVKPWPGIVDVEPMPGGDDEDADEGSPADAGGGSSA